MLQILLRGVVDSHAEMAVVHDQSLQLLNQRVASEIDSIVGAMAAAVVATASIQNQLVRPSHTIHIGDRANTNNGLGGLSHSSCRFRIQAK